MTRSSLLRRSERIRKLSWQFWHAVLDPKSLQSIIITAGCVACVETFCLRYNWKLSGSGVYVCKTDKRKLYKQRGPVNTDQHLLDHSWKSDLYPVSSGGTHRTRWAEPVLTLALWRIKMIHLLRPLKGMHTAQYVEQDHKHTALMFLHKRPISLRSV